MKVLSKNNKVLMRGGGAGYGSIVGAFCGSWDGAAGVWRLLALLGASPSQKPIRG